MLNWEMMIAQLGLSPWDLCLFGIMIVWSAIWKGIALWKSAKKNSPVWFVVLFLVNTVGILEILYIYVFSEMKNKKTASRTRRRRRR